MESKKSKITINLDNEIIDYFKSIKDSKYQTEINKVLLRYMKLKDIKPGLYWARLASSGFIWNLIANFEGAFPNMNVTTYNIETHFVNHDVEIRDLEIDARI